MDGVTLPKQRDLPQSKQTEQKPPLSTVNTQWLVSHCIRSSAADSLTCLWTSVYIIPKSGRQAWMSPKCEKSI